MPTPAPITRRMPSPGPPPRPASDEDEPVIAPKKIKQKNFLLSAGFAAGPGAEKPALLGARRGRPVRDGLTAVSKPETAPGPTVTPVRRTNRGWTRIIARNVGFRPPAMRRGSGTAPQNRCRSGNAVQPCARLRRARKLWLLRVAKPAPAVRSGDRHETKPLQCGNRFQSQDETDSRRGKRSPPGQPWCGWGDSNSHALRRSILSALRLPFRHTRAASAYSSRWRASTALRRGPLRRAGPAPDRSRHGPSRIRRLRTDCRAESRAGPSGRYRPACPAIRPDRSHAGCARPGPSSAGPRTGSASSGR